MQRNREKNRMGKTGDLFKKIRNTKGIFHAKMGTIKDRNGMDLTEAEDIKKRFPILQIINILCAMNSICSYNTEKIKNQQWRLWEYKILPYYVFKI